MLKVLLSTRFNFDIEGFIEMLQALFSDSDTNGDNGEEYFYHDVELTDGRLQLVFDNEKGEVGLKSINDILADYVRQVYEKLDEVTIAKQYADFYTKYSINAYDAQAYEYHCGADGYITAITYAFVE